MTDSPLHKLSVLNLASAENERLGLPHGLLLLQRAWPRSHDHLLLEYAAGNTSIAGQWFASTRQLQADVRKTAGKSVQKRRKLLELPSLGVMLQADGVDRRLPSLASLVTLPGAQLVSHRPEQRAVVRLELPDGLFYAKVVVPERAQELAGKTRSIRKMAGSDFFVPEVVELNLDTGTLILSALGGQSLYHLLSSHRLTSAARAAGKALRKLHSFSDSLRPPRHGPGKEIETIKFWLKHAKLLVPHLYFQLYAVASNVFRSLAADQSPAVLLHRDFYDKQMFVGEQGQIGFLDFDTLAFGEAALDISNALVHFELRHLQGRLSETESMAAAEAFLDGYQPEPHVRLRLQAYMDAARVRLGCVYAFRPYQSHLVTLILSQVKQQICC
jgi:hypothetical protein